MSLSTTSTSTPKLSDDTTSDGKSQPPSDTGVLSSALNAIHQQTLSTHSTSHNAKDTRVNGHGTFTEPTLRSALHGNGHSAGVASPEPVSVMAQLAEEMRMHIELSEEFPGLGMASDSSPCQQLDRGTLAVLKQWIDRKWTAAELHTDEVWLSIV